MSSVWREGVILKETGVSFPKRSGGFGLFILTSCMILKCMSSDVGRYIYFGLIQSYQLLIETSIKVVEKQCKPIALIWNTQYTTLSILYVECSQFVTFSLVWNYLENTTEILSTASRHLAIHKKYYYNGTTTSATPLDRSWHVTAKCQKLSKITGKGLSTAI